MNRTLSFLDRCLIEGCQKSNVVIARIAMFIVYFWFGIIKVVAESPANPLVDSLLQQTLPFLTFEQFIVGFGVFEVLIGILFLIPKFDRLAIGLFFAHMITTFMPLVVLPAQTWQSFLVPTLEGQYIVKNVVLIAAVVSIIAHLHPVQIFQTKNSR